MSFQRTIFLAVFLNSMFISSNASQDLCMLCEDGLEGLHYPNAVIKSDGTTCTQMAVDTAVNYDAGSDACYLQLEAWRQICCGDNRPIDVKITESIFETYPDIDEIETVGDYPKCDVCRDGDYPSAEGMVINMLYVGEGTCPQYWKLGQQGLIPRHLCDPLQFFAYEPCGCGEFSTNGNYNWDQPYNGDSPSQGESDGDDDERPWWSFSNNNNGNTNNNDNDEKPWWSFSNNNGNGNNDDDEDAWWSSANGNHGKTDDEAPWWANADSYSAAAVLTSSHTQTWTVAAASALIGTLAMLMF